MNPKAVSRVALITIATTYLILIVASASAATDYSQATAQYTHASVTGAFPDGLRFRAPSVIGADFALGYVDITQKPFSADPTGTKDATRAIQTAIDFARQNQLVTYFPGGRYLVSDTLRCIQGYYRRTNGVIGPARIFPNVLIGSRRGIKPTLVLAPNAPGFGNPHKPKYVVHFWSRSLEDPEIEKPNISFNQGIQGINIDLGKSNPGAIGLRHRGAQGTFIQDVAIMAGNSLKGMEGGLGSGGTMANITVVGGQIGMDLSETQPAPVLVGAKLINQKGSALIYKGAQTLTIVGSHFVSTASGPLLKSFARRRPFSGQIVIVDSMIEFTQGSGIIIKPEASVYFKNVFTKNAGQIFWGKALSHDQQIPAGHHWIHIKEATHRIDPHSFRGYAFTMPVIVNGTIVDQEINEVREHVDPPENLLARHAWNGPARSWDSEGFINIKDAPYFAKGNGVADDTQAIQSALDENPNIFLPKGVYLLNRPVKITKPVNIRGVASHLSIISFSGQGPKLADKSTSVLEVATRTGITFLESLGIHVYRDIANLYALNLNQSHNVSMRNVAFLTRPTRYGRKVKSKFTPLGRPLVNVSQSAGIKIFGFYQEDYRGHESPYRHLAINNCPGPVSIYVCNVEHSGGFADLEIGNSHNVSVYGLKSEGNNHAAYIHNSEDILIAGYGGNASAFPNRSLFLLKNSSRVNLVSLTDSPRFKFIKHQKPNIFGQPIPPQDWNMVIDIRAQPFITPPLARPLVYSIRSVDSVEKVIGPPEF